MTDSDFGIHPVSVTKLSKHPHKMRWWRCWSCKTQKGQTDYGVQHLCGSELPVYGCDLSVTPLSALWHLSLSIPAQTSAILPPALALLMQFVPTVCHSLECQQRSVSDDKLPTGSAIRGLFAPPMGMGKRIQYVLYVWFWKVQICTITCPSFLSLSLAKVQ